MGDVQSASPASTSECRGNDSWAPLSNETVARPVFEDGEGETKDGVGDKDSTQLSENTSVLTEVDAPGRDGESSNQVADTLSPVTDTSAKAVGSSAYQPKGEDNGSFGARPSKNAQPASPAEKKEGRGNVIEAQVDRPATKDDGDAFPSKKKRKKKKKTST